VNYFGYEIVIKPVEKVYKVDLIWNGYLFKDVLEVKNKEETSKLAKKYIEDNVQQLQKEIAEHPMYKVDVNSIVLKIFPNLKVERSSQSGHSSLHSYYVKDTCFTSMSVSLSFDLCLTVSIYSEYIEDGEDFELNYSKDFESFVNKTEAPEKYLEECLNLVKQSFSKLLQNHL
jgi:hypothetical protein